METNGTKLTANGEMVKMSKEGETLVIHSTRMVEALKHSGWEVEDNHYFVEPGPRDRLTGLGLGGFSAELPVEWNVLAAASHRCLLGRLQRGWLEREMLPDQPPASVLWELSNKELGEFGTFEVRKIRPGWSQITFSGLGPLSGFKEGTEEIKKEHMQEIIDVYYFMLSQENIFPEKTEPVGPEIQETVAKVGADPDDRKRAVRTDVISRVALALYLQEKDHCSRRQAANKAHTTTSAMGDHEHSQDVQNKLREFKANPGGARDYQSLLNRKRKVTA